MKPLISVIVPVYNAAPYLRKCLDSIMMQTYQELEIILVNDGSTDESGAICDEYSMQDLRVKAVHQSNSGISAARNTGLSLARGEWVGWIDADDWIALDFYEYLLESAHRYHADIVQCAYLSVQGSKVVRQYAPIKETVFSLGSEVYAGHKRCFWANSLWNKLYRRQLFQGLQCNECFSIGEDLLLNIAVLTRAGTIVLLPEAKYYYLQREDSVCNAVPDKEHFVSYRKALQFAEQEFLRSEGIRRFLREELLRNDLHMCSRMVCFHLDWASDIGKELRGEIRHNLLQTLICYRFTAKEKLKFLVISFLWPAYLYGLPIWRAFGNLECYKGDSLRWLQSVRKAIKEGVLFQKGARFVFHKIQYAGCLFYARLLRTDSQMILFLTHQGTYSCNPKYIFEELQRRHLPYQLVFVTDGATEDFPEKMTVVQKGSMAYFRALNTARVVVVNSIEFAEAPISWRKDRIVLQTWHGSLGIKRYGPQDNSDRRWQKLGWKSAELTSFLLSNSAFEEMLYRDTFWKKTPILRYGHPRNDLLFCKEVGLPEQIRSRIEGRYTVQLKQNIVLYAPTFRNHFHPDCYAVDFERLCRALSMRFGGEWGVLLRLHPMERSMLLDPYSNVLDVTDYPDMQELLLIADVGITDYSSWIYDFMLTRRPGFLFALDSARYEAERGLYFPLESTPFPVAEDNDMLERNILAFSEQQYREAVERFLAEKGCMEDGNAARRIADKITVWMEKQI